MDKRYQIFVSSTYKDLHEERAKVVRAIQQGGNIPTGMELWPAASNTPWKVIDSFLRVCDYYVLVIKARYGSIDDETGLSFTEREYDRAFELGVPVLAFVFQDMLSVQIRDAESDPKRKQQLQDFIAKVRSRHTTSTWANGDELMYEVGNAIRAEIESTPRPGWVRGDTAVDPKVLVEQERLRQENHELRQQLAATANAAPVGASHFAGLDTLMHFDSKVLEEFRDYGDYTVQYEASDRTQRKVKYVFPLADVLKHLGTYLWSGVPTADILQLISAMIADHHDSMLKRTKRNGVYVNSVEIEKAAGDRVIFQLYALGLITESDVKGPDEAKWILTKFGRQQVVYLLAVPAKSEEERTG